ncbi:hypothetical protein KIN20_029525 [Parelaphostrongylus tenuis]|uniref:Uncharacterized protein n=1 Tax=Parelaphostrongylus tenuis TaxID=148309 RepID=A0AAD5MVF8_PARTN|nr:hypothetical protein KIN20_025573 [Parelaphostrongylus tenuis]KAJ1368401.1 hypothetical protein KIN20_029525 [Parelaphostrongylus tenuis]
MDEDKFPFEDHDLGSLNGAVRQGEDENGYDDDYSEDSRELNFPVCYRFLSDEFLTVSW